MHLSLSKCLHSLLLHRLRTLLSTLGVLFGVVAVIAMLSIGEGAKQETLDQIEQLGVNSVIIRQNTLSEEQHLQAREKRSKGLSLEDGQALIHGIPSLLMLAPLKMVEASLTGTLKEIAPEILATTRQYGEIKGVKTMEGRFLCDHDIKGKRLVCVLGYDVARQLGKEGHVGSTLRIENVQYQIVGVLQPTQWKERKNVVLASRNLNKSVLIPLGTESSLPLPRHLRNHTLNEIILQIEPKQPIHQAAKMVKPILNRLHGGHEDYQVIVPQELLDQAYRTQRTFNLVLGSIAAISLLVGGIGIMNIMLATVSERTREIGIRRAVGASKGHIIEQFLLETLVLTLLGAAMGVLIGLLFSWGISYFAGWKTIVTLWSILLSFGMASGVGLASGLYPALKAANMNPIMALRHD